MSANQVVGQAQLGKVQAQANSIPATVTSAFNGVQNVRHGTAWVNANKYVHFGAENGEVNLKGMAA